MKNIRERLARVFGRASAPAHKDDLMEASTIPTRPELLGTTGLSTAHNGLRSTLKLMAPYWLKADAREKMIAWPMLAGAIGAIVWQVDILVQFAQWQGAFFDLFQNAIAAAADNKELLKTDPEQFTAKMLEQFSDLPEHVKDFGLIIAKFMTSVALSFSLKEFTSLRWRTWMTEKYNNDWLSNNAFYRLPAVYGESENPDQRIQEDINKFTSGVMSLATDAVGSALTLYTFSRLLWHTGDFNLAAVGGPDMLIPGFMFWLAAGYAGGWTLVTHAIGRPLVTLDRQQQMREAFFRSDLKRVSENAESIALNGGADVEKAVLKKSFNNVMLNAKDIIIKRKQLILSRALYGNMSIVVPYTAATPMIVAGKVSSFGGLQKNAYYFGQVQSSFSWFIDNYQNLADLSATTIRLSGMTAAIDKSNTDLALKQQDPETANDNHQIQSKKPRAASGPTAP